MCGIASSPMESAGCAECRSCFVRRQAGFRGQAQPSSARRPRHADQRARPRRQSDRGALSRMRPRRGIEEHAEPATRPRRSGPHRATTRAQLHALLRGRTLLRAFVHRTFLEYFCALEIQERFQMEQTVSLEQLKSEIFAHWADESWHEVLCLLSGMIAPRFVAQVLAYLLQQPDPQQTCHAIFLAARCVGEVRKRNELGSITGEVLDRVKALISFDLNFFYQPWDEEDARVFAIRTRAVGMVALIWRDAPATRTWLKERATSDMERSVRGAAIQELARGWKEDPDTLPWLKKRATSDSEGSVRGAAIRELARGWKEDSAVGERKIPGSDSR